MWVHPARKYVLKATRKLLLQHVRPVECHASNIQASCTSSQLPSCIHAYTNAFLGHSPPLDCTCMYTQALAHAPYVLDPCQTPSCLTEVSIQATAHGDVLVEFRRLEPGSFVSFTPKSTEFQTIVNASGIDLAALLQGTLMRHTTLSEGDWISVPMPLSEPAAGAAEGASGEVSHQWLQVCQLQPDAHVSLVDTDMEADVTPSQEFMERMAAEQEAARKEAERVAALEAEEARRQADAAAVCLCSTPGMPTNWDPW